MTQSPETLAAGGVIPTGTTPSGLPYPESTEALNQGANAIKALALAVDPRLPTAATPVTRSATAVVTTNASGDANVPFTPPFSAAPTSVIAIHGDSAPAIGILPYSGAYITATGFSIKAVYLNSGAPVGGGVRVNWIAQGTK